MRRMLTQQALDRLFSKPNEENLIACQQFVADEIVLNNVEEGLYLVELTQTDGDHIIYSQFTFNFKYESQYGAVYSPFFYDVNNDVIIALKGEYSGNSKTITLTLINTQGIVIQSPKSFHIDIYKLQEELSYEKNEIR